MPEFLQSVRNFINKIAGVKGKTIPCVKLILKYPDEKKPDKVRKEYKKLIFNADYTALLEPEGLIIPWEIEETKDDKFDNYSDKTEHSG